jgi:5-(hydroxymethyl)furfural/furfural oxidase
MHVSLSSRSGWHAVGHRVAAMTCWVNRSYSTGRVRLPAAPGTRADIDFRMLSDPRDMQRLKAGFRLCVRAMTEAQQRGATLATFPSGYSTRIRNLTRPGAWNGAIMAIAAPLMDHNAVLRRWIMQYAVETGAAPRELACDDDLLEAHLRHNVNGIWHASGTCRMGDPADPMAVVDPAGRVIGVAGLRVCDASVFPAIPCANLNIPVLMTAEKIAATIRAGARADAPGGNAS